MGTMLRENTTLLPAADTPAIKGGPVPQSNCAHCALLRDLDPIMREIIVLRQKGQVRLASLTPRQLEVMHMVVAGHPSKNIAMDLHLSQRTVENHRAQIMHRTGCKSVPELSRMAFCASWYLEAEPPA